MTKGCSWVCVLVAGIILLGPFLDFQPLLSTGDHGRDLYTFQQVAAGQPLYRKLWWQYGPLMPYYYAGCFKLLGPKIQSVLIGKVLVEFLSGGCFFLTASLLLPASLAVLAACAYWVFAPDFIYTYCHSGGLFFLNLILYCLMAYQCRGPRRYVLGGLAAVVCLNFVRLNVGLAALAAFVFGLWFSDRKSGRDPNILTHPQLRAMVLMSVFVTVAGYYVLVRDIPPAALKQCFPYFTEYRYGAISPGQGILRLVSLAWGVFRANALTMAGGLLLLGLSIRGFLFLKRPGDQQRAAQSLAVALLSLAVLSILTAHEILVSWLFFRLNWAYPAFLLFIFLLIGLGAKTLSACLRGGLLAFLVLMIALGGFLRVRAAHFYKCPANRFVDGPHEITISNALAWESLASRTAHPGTGHAWIQTVSQVSAYLKTQVPEGKTFLAVPYHGLYYFLTERRSPVYPLAFFRYMNISPNEELAMIRVLEDQGVDYVVISNRAYARHEPYLGIFGLDTCPVLADYIFENFVEVEAFGNWGVPAGFAWNHAVKVFKRKGR